MGDPTDGDGAVGLCSKRVGRKGLEEMALLAEGFDKGFKMGTLPKGVKLPNAGTWLSDIRKTGKWCRKMAERHEDLKQEHPGACERQAVIRDNLFWIEECAGWVRIYGRMDLDRAAREAKQERYPVDRKNNGRPVGDSDDGRAQHN
jgi:hypothetical protein